MLAAGSDRGRQLAWSRGRRAGGPAEPRTQIVLRAGRYRLSVRPSDTDDNRSGDLNITRARNLTIVGAGSATTVIDASGLGDRVLSITSGARVTLSRLAIHGGHATGGTAGAPGAGVLTCAPGSPASVGASGGGISTRER